MYRAQNLCLFNSSTSLNFNTSYRYYTRHGALFAILGLLNRLTACYHIIVTIRVTVITLFWHNEWQLSCCDNWHTVIIWVTTSMLTQWHLTNCRVTFSLGSLSKLTIVIVVWSTTPEIRLLTINILTTLEISHHTKKYYLTNCDITDKWHLPCHNLCSWQISQHICLF